MIFNQLKQSSPVTENYDFIPIREYIQMESFFESYSYLSNIDSDSEIVIEGAVSNFIKKIIDFFKKLFAKIKEFFNKDTNENTSDSPIKDSSEDISSELKKKKKELEDMIEARKDKQARDREEMVQKKKEFDNKVEQVLLFIESKSNTFVYASDAKPLIGLTKDKFKQFENERYKLEKGVKYIEDKASDFFYNDDKLKRLIETSTITKDNFLDGYPKTPKTPNVFKSFDVYSYNKFDIHEVKTDLNYVKTEAKIGFKKVMLSEKEVVSYIKSFEKLVGHYDEKNIMSTLNIYAEQTRRLIEEFIKYLAHLIRMCNREINTIVDIEKRIGALAR